jgi:hypothetical protein
MGRRCRNAPPPRVIGSAGGMSPPPATGDHAMLSIYASENLEGTMPPCRSGRRAYRAARAGRQGPATLLLVMLGGGWVPSFVFPPWLQTVTQAAPTRCGIDGLDAMTGRGLPLAAAWPPVAALPGFGVSFGGLAIARFDWEAA